MMVLPHLLATAVREKRLAFRRRVLRWGRANLRPYPWREAGRTPYDILVAELLLKRTTATAAARAYSNFLSRYPTIECLASVPTKELEQHLQPVGLYVQRAKAITGLAEHLMQREGGSIPSSLSRLGKGPGLGDYAARAVLSFGFGVPVAAVDANVARVIGRVFQKALRDRPAPSVIQGVADELLPRAAHREFNFGLLDLGAVVCRYGRPRCDECPLTLICDYYCSGEAPKRGQPGEALRKARLAKRMALVELAKRAGVSKLTIVNIEAGRTRPRPETIARLISVLGDGEVGILEEA